MADLTQTAANVKKVSGTAIAGTGGATLTAGMAVYKDTADGNQYKEADADAAASAKCAGILLNNVSDDQPLDIQSSGVVNLGATLVVGTVYVVSAGGGIAPVADLVTGKFVCVLGVAITTSNLLLSIIDSQVAVP